MELKKKDILYWARIIPQIGMYEVPELIVRTVEDEYFVACDKRTKHAHLFSYGVINKFVFKDRNKALQLVKEAEKNKKNISEERYYEEY